MDTVTVMALVLAALAVFLMAGVCVMGYLIYRLSSDSQSAASTRERELMSLLDTSYGNQWAVCEPWSRFQIEEAEALRLHRTDEPAQQIQVGEPDADAPNTDQIGERFFRMNGGSVSPGPG